MAQAVLTIKGTVVPRWTMRNLTKAELHIKSAPPRETFDKAINIKLGNYMSFPVKPSPPNFIPYTDKYEPDLLDVPIDIDHVDDNNVAMFEQTITEYWIHNKVYLPQGEKLVSTKVISRSKGLNGQIVETYDKLLSIIQQFMMWNFIMETLQSVQLM